MLPCRNIFAEIVPCSTVQFMQLSKSAVFDKLLEASSQASASRRKDGRRHPCFARSQVFGSAQIFGCPPGGKHHEISHRSLCAHTCIHHAQFLACLLGRTTSDVSQSLFKFHWVRANIHTASSLHGHLREGTHTGAAHRPTAAESCGLSCI